MPSIIIYEYYLLSFSFGAVWLGGKLFSCEKYYNICLRTMENLFYIETLIKKKEIRESVRYFKLIDSFNIYIYIYMMILIDYHL